MTQAEFNENLILLDGTNTGDLIFTTITITIDNNQIIQGISLSTILIQVVLFKIMMFQLI